jgi:hypothetical protein
MFTSPTMQCHWRWCLCGCLQELALKQRDRMFARQIANMVWSLGICRTLQFGALRPSMPALPATVAEQPAGRVRGRAARMLGARRLAAALLSELASGGGGDYAKLWRGGNAKDVAQLLHGMGRLRLRDAHTLGRLAAFVRRRPQQFEASQLALAAWGFGQLEFHDAALFEELAARVVDQRWYLRPWSMAALLGAFARHRHHSPRLCEAVTEVRRAAFARVVWGKTGGGMQQAIYAPWGALPQG